MLTALAAGIASVAGCLGGVPSERTETTTDTASTTLPPSNVEFPDGPKERPERPSTLTESTVREYVKAHEYRYVYNSLWMGAHTNVTLDCRVDSVERREWGYATVVTCTGSSRSDPPENATATGAHADWFTQSYRYRVSENTTRRREAENRDPV